MGRLELDVVLPDNNTFRHLIDASSAFVQKTVVQVNSEEGMKVNSLDPHDVGLVTWCFKPSCFEKFHCVRNRTLKIPLDFKQLLHVLKCAMPGEAITLRKYALEDDLIVILGEESAESFFNIRLLDIEHDPVETLSSGSDQSTIRMIAAEFHSMVASFAHLDDTLHIDLSRKGIGFTCKGKLGNAGIYYPHNTIMDYPSVKPRSVLIDLKGESISEEYNIKYLKTFSKGCPLSKEAVLRISGERDNILEITFPMEDPNAFICFYLGPRHKGPE